MQKVILSATLVSIFLINSAYAEVHLSKNNHVVKSQTSSKAVVANQGSKYAVAGKLSSLGAGLDVTYRLKPKVNLRFNLNGGSLKGDADKDGINYEVQADLLTIGGLVDYHPRAGNFRLSAGLYNNKNELNLRATPTGNTSATIGGTSYNLTGTSLNTDVDFKSIAPYLGLGWGNAVKPGSQWRFSFDAGVLFQSSPDVRMTATGRLGSDTTFQTSLAEEEIKLSNDLNDFKALPVISLGVSYRFK